MTMIARHSLVNPEAATQQQFSLALSLHAPRVSSAEADRILERSAKGSGMGASVFLRQMFLP